MLSLFCLLLWSSIKCWANIANHMKSKAPRVRQTLWQQTRFVCVYSVGEKRTRRCCGREYNGVGGKALNLDAGRGLHVTADVYHRDGAVCLLRSQSAVHCSPVSARYMQSNRPLSLDFCPWQEEFQPIKTEFSPKTWKKGGVRNSVFHFPESWYFFDNIVVIGLIKFLAQK